MDIYSLLLLCLIGIVAGFISGIMGVGGAIIIVPALVFIFGFSQHQAQGTSLAVLLFPVGILAVMNYYRKGYINMKFALVIIITFIIGSYLGSLVSVNLPERELKKIFGILLLIVGANMIFGK
jgi:uncharacterized membrane protein YfcA